MSRIRIRDITLLDRVYEHVTLPPIIVQAIDTPYFQRLRGLKQLGVSSYLYPGAVHTRFEHSIGVAHMSRTFLQAIRAKQPELQLTENDIQKVMLAGLCHDIGHGPFSHLFEDVIVGKFSVGSAAASFCHEKMSEKIMRGMLASLVSPEDIEHIASLMKGDTRSNIVYGDVICNKRCGIDVDRLDYFIRDSLCCFGKPSVDVRVHRLFQACRVLQDEKGSWMMAFEAKLAITMRELFSLRAKLHKNVYQHQVVKAVGHMIGDALGHAAPTFKIHGRSLLECTTDLEAFCFLGDWIVEAIEASDNPGLMDAQKVLRRLRMRDLYRLVDTGALRSVLDPLFDVRNIQREIVEEGQSQFVEDDFIVDVVTINFGKGPHDALLYVPFFNPKQRPTKLISVEHGSSPMFTPSAFEEKTVMFFSKQEKHIISLSEAIKRWKRRPHVQRSLSSEIPFFNSSIPSPA